MPIDPTGTAPGILPEKPEQKKVFMKCKRNGCDSMEAIEMNVGAPLGQHLYRCAKCHHPHAIATGGTFSY